MLTVVLPTRNGADTIGRTLQAMRAVAPPPGGWCLIIVNNASTDNTAEIIHGFATDLPLLYLVEPRLGKANAINAAIAHTVGDLIVFTDDDVLPASNWLCEWRRVADKYPGIGIFGGAIVPEFESPPPHCLHDDWKVMLYAATTPTLGEGAFGAHVSEVFGPNMAVRSTVLDAGYRFDPNMMQGSGGLMGDETQFVIRARRGGTELGFAPTACVRHIVDRSQVTWRWILRRFYRHGRTMMYINTTHDDSDNRRPPCIAGIPRYLFRRIAEQSLLVPVAFVSGNAEAIMSRLRMIAYDLGAARQARLMYKTDS